MSDDETVLVTGGSGYIGGWDEAAAGCDFVLHVASPLGVADPKDPNDLIVPAREGARRAVGAAIKAGVKRVVLTSSVAATGKVPDLVIRLAGLFEKDLGSLTPGLGHKHDFSSAKAQTLLGWKSRPLGETILDCANSLIAIGAV